MVTHGERRSKRVDSGDLPLIQSLCGLHQGEWIAARCFHQCPYCVGRYVCLQRRQQLRRIVKVESAERHARKALQESVDVRISSRRQNDAKSVIGDTTGGEEHGEEGTRLQPLDIVNHDDGRDLERRRSQQRKPPSGHRQLVTAALGPLQRQCRTQCCALHCGQLWHELKYRSEQAGQPGVSQMRFTLDPQTTKDGHILGERRDEALQEARLAAAGFSLDHYNTADAAASSLNEFIELVQLGLTSQQHGVPH
jgi:hypothetical protein